MFSTIKFPKKDLDTTTAFSVIQKATSKPKGELKKFLGSLGSPLGKKIVSNKPYHRISPKELKKILSETHQKGMFVSKSKLSQELKRLAELEKQRKIEYSKGRAKLVDRLRKIKSGDEDLFFSREIEKSKNKRLTSHDDYKERRMKKVAEMFSKLPSQKTDSGPEKPANNLSNLNKKIHDLPID